MDTTDREGQRGLRLLNMDRVLDRLPFSRTVLYGRLARGEFPAPVKAGKLNAWLESDIDDFIEQLVGSQRDGESA